MVHTKELFSLDGRVAIVTGGRGLYGSSITEGLCEMEATVVIASRNGAKCDEFAETLRQQGYDAIGLSLDLGDDASIKMFVEEVYERYGHINILVNNAVDRSNMVNMGDATREQLQSSVSTNLNGQILLSQEVLKYMVAAQKGNIINISSMRGIDCPHFPYYKNGHPVNYTTEKWAMVGLTKYMAGRYGKHGIRVNCVAPGGFTAMGKEKPLTEAQATFMQNYIDHCPLHRWAEEDDIKGPVAFLASDAASYVTGATLVMDGGWTIW